MRGNYPDTCTRSGNGIMMINIRSISNGLAIVLKYLHLPTCLIAGRILRKIIENL